ncbi:MAG: PqqD family protein [Candidatus Aminicenantales bacterium]
MKRKNDFLIQNIGGQDLLVPLGAKVIDLNGIIVLNSTGRYIWELLAEHCSLDDLVAALEERFVVDSQRARIDVQAFVSEISKWDAIET